jgi:acyl-coenzyme A synthetase/AMP-(fatty) acid ligase
VLDPKTSRDLIRRFPFSIVEVFGSSESGGIAFRDPRTTPAWRPFEGITVTADAEGRLLLDSPFLPPDSLRPFPCADRVSLEPDGTFHHAGRADSVVKIGGERVSVTEIEQKLRSVPGVCDAAVRAISTGGARQWELWAAVVAPDLTEASLRDVLSSALDTVAIPRRILFESALPREDSGKLVHDRFVALFARNAAADGANRLSRGDLP